jgi:DNA-binding NarL/FixJ family response regulator
MIPDARPRAYDRAAVVCAAATGRTRMKVLIVDDHPLIREALANVLAELGHEVTVLQAESLKGALAELAAHPDTTLILLDLMLPDAEGTSVLGEVRQAYPDVPVVVLSANDNRATVLAAIDGGAMGFISKRSASPVLVNALRLVLAGEVYIPPEVLRAETLPRPVAGAALAAGTRRTGEELGLTPRQMDVLTLLVQGKPNKVICRELGLAEGTVKTHTAAIFRALAVSNRTQAVFAVSRLGIQLPFVPAPDAAPGAARRA